MTKKFSSKIAKDVAQHQFNWTIGCIIGTDDPDYFLFTDVEEFEQNFEETLEEIGINPTPKRIELIKKHYLKLNNKAILLLEKMCKKVNF